MQTISLVIWKYPWKQSRQVNISTGPSHRQSYEQSCTDTISFRSRIVTGSFLGGGHLHLPALYRWPTLAETDESVYKMEYGLKRAVAIHRLSVTMIYHVSKLPSGWEHLWQADSSLIHPSMSNHEMYLYVPSRTEKGPMDRYDLNLTGMPCFVGWPVYASGMLYITTYMHPLLPFAL